MKLSILIVSYNVRDLLERCLASLKVVQGIEFEVIVVDNASRDGTQGFLEEYTTDYFREAFVNTLNFVYIPSVENLGFAGGNVEALKHAKGEYVLLLNPDTEVLPKTVETMVQYLDTHPDVGIVGPRLLNSDRSLQRSVRGFPTLLSQIFILLKLHNYFCRSYSRVVIPGVDPESKQKQKNKKIFSFFDSRFRGNNGGLCFDSLNQYFLPDFDYSKVQDVDQVMGAALLTRRSIIAKVGFLDAGFKRWFEEVDFCFRVKHSGLRVVYIPDAQIIHSKGSSFNQTSAHQSHQLRHSGLNPESRKENKKQKDSLSGMLKKQFFFNQGMLRFFWKQKPAWQSVALLPFLALSFCVTALLWLALKLKIPLMKRGEL